MTTTDDVFMIVGTDRSGAIGKGNALPWHHRGDMQHFKQTTTGHIVVMGYNTYESMKGKALPNRHNVVISGRHFDRIKMAEFPPLYPTEGMRSMVAANSPGDGMATAKSIQALLKLSLGIDAKIFIMGGASIYNALLPATNVIIQSRLDLEVRDADTFFPFEKIDPIHWDREVMEFPAGLTHEDDVAFELITHRRK